MNTNGTNGVMGWFKQNLWALLLIIASFIFGYATLNARVDAMESKLAEYPSEDYFTLKFSSIDKKLTEIETLVVKHIDVNDK